jgi:wobble nucleotide-excising tRNase
MLSAINLLRNVGQFDSVSPGTSAPLEKLTIVYAENGRGKTTVASILRSLSLGDPNFVLERHRLGASNAPHIVLSINGQQYSFQNSAWTSSLSDIAIFDDNFVSQNICSGIEVVTSHRQKLHELILGAQGVALNSALQLEVARVEEHNRLLRERESAIPTSLRGDLSIDAFCALPQVQSIEELIQEAQRILEAAKSADVIRSRRAFDELALPSFDIEELNNLLQSDLPGLHADAVKQVQEHFAKTGRGAEAWVADGMQRIQISPGSEEQVCPFCAQDLHSSLLINHYQLYFSSAYTTLKQRIVDMERSVAASHGQEIPASFERSIRVVQENIAFWNRFISISPVTVDTAEIVRVWRTAREAVLVSLRAKLASPLEPMSLPSDTRQAIDDYHQHRNQIAELSSTLVGLNTEIALIKERVQTANVGILTNDLTRLIATRTRHTVETNSLCQAYLDEKEAKRVTENNRATARQALDAYRSSIFNQYESLINVYLGRFNAGFRLSSITSTNNRAGSSCTYNLLINNLPVSISSDTGPAFKNTLSAGDRNTLALAFFFASLEQHPRLQQKIVIIDDPMTSLDEHRSLATIHEIKDLTQRVEQVIVMSHSKPFLFQLWEATDRLPRTAVRINRNGQSSAISAWNVNDDLVTENDKRHLLVREYINTGDSSKAREVATALRPMLEAYLRVAYPIEFPPGSLLGNFHNRCEQRLITGPALLNSNDTSELRRLMDYTNRFHHDTNPAYATENINETELLSYCNRVLQFTKK